MSERIQYAGDQGRAVQAGTAIGLAREKKICVNESALETHGILAMMGAGKH